MSTPSHARAIERARIVDAYARRTRDEQSYFGYEGTAHLHRQQERQRETLALLSAVGLQLAGSTVLDVGCGTGDGLLDFVRWGLTPAQLAGVDLRADALATAAKRLPGVDLHLSCATELPFAKQSFDIVQQATMFSSVLDLELRGAIADEMVRVLKPGGVILSYDTRRDNPRNADVGALTEDDLRSLFPDGHVTVRAITLAPHRVRGWSSSVLEAIQPWARWLGVGQTHLLALIRPCVRSTST